jgi:Cys-rich protein (TIGR01571 family)
MLSKAKAAAASKMTEAKTAVQHAASAGAGALAKVTPAVAAVPVPPPPPRENWTYGIFATCFKDFGFGSRACICPCLAVERVASYMDTGREDAPINYITIGMSLLCMGDSVSGVREAVRQKTNMTPGECCPCNSACIDTCIASAFCWGCSLAQDRRELQVYFGHAGPEAPRHPGTPAATAVAALPVDANAAATGSLPMATAASFKR